MDNEVIKKRGRKPNTNNLNDDDLKKQQKRHQYYLNFKNKHPFYYKKPNSILGRPPKKETTKEITSILEIKNNIIDEIILKLQKLKVDNTEFY